MPYEVVFSQEPYNGTAKFIVELIDENSESIEVAVDSTSSQSQFSSEQSSTESSSELPTTPANASTTPTQTSSDVESRSKAIRASVNKYQQKNAEAMEKKHNIKRNKRTLEYQVGELVTDLITRIYRGGSDLPRLPGIIGRNTGGKDTVHESRFGILNDKLRACELEPYSVVLDIDTTKIINKISLREAARLTSNRSADLQDLETTCNCNGNCADKRCGCYLRSKKCGSHCHLRSRENCCKNKN